MKVLPVVSDNIFVQKNKSFYSVQSCLFFSLVTGQYNVAVLRLAANMGFLAHPD